MKDMKGKQSFSPGDVIRMPHYATCPNQWRVWYVSGVHLGGSGQEGTYELLPVDVMPNEPVHVPCIMLETHMLIERVTYQALSRPCGEEEG